MNTSFFVGFCFLDAEDGEGFKWTLERLRGYDELGIRQPTAIVSDRDTTFLEELFESQPSKFKGVGKRWTMI
jgi:hypothetical protein